MPLFDIAVNSGNRQMFDDFDALLQRSLAAGVDKWLMVGTDVAESQQILALAKRDESDSHLYCTAGVHPHDAKSVSDDYLAQLKTLHQDPKVVAVGECGLDFNRNFSPREQQQKVFVEQLQLAVELGKPVYMHERDAQQTFAALYRPFADQLVNAVLHCFTSDQTALRQYLDMGLHIGITGWLCDERRGLALRELIRYIPLDRLMIETDSPFLLPRSLKPKPKSRRNEPAFLPHIAATIAEILALEPVAVANATYRNSCRFFAIDGALT